MPTYEMLNQEENGCPLKVKLDWNHAKKRPHKKRSKALRTANRTIHELEEKLNKISRENKMLRKRNKTTIKKLKTRSSLECSSVPTTSASEQFDTPNSKAKRDINVLGLTPKRVPTSVKKKLIMANAMLEEIKASSKKNKKQKKKRVVANVVSGNIIKKYRCLHMLSRETGLGRKILKGAKSKSLSTLSRRRRVIEQEAVKLVVAFMERDDVSINMPGKNDCRKTEKGCKGEKKQKRVLNDYLGNLYEKFRSENPSAGVSKTVFCRLRPKNILLTKMISRNTCLCTKHQNFAMKLKALRTYGVDISANPETVSKNVSEEEFKKKIDESMENVDEVKYQEWKRVEVDGKKKMKIVETTLMKNDFKKQMESQYFEFLQHVHRVKTQYSAIRVLKERLPENEMLVHMDFAENFTCSNADEIQSAYWNSTAVTLHPVVVYYRLGDELEHKNFIFVSDVTNHNATAVYTILRKLVPELKAVSPDLKVIHYWTDSPSSQYRNKYMIDITQRHTEIFNVAARWNYFESGHGKGPCDGLGGVAKRQAAEACKQGKVNIQDAHDFYHWASGNEKTIKYVFYSGFDYEATALELESKTPKAVQGTMKLHAVFPVENVLYTAEVSCYCDTCLIGSPCGHWKKEGKSDKDNFVCHSAKRKRPSTDHGLTPIKVLKTTRNMHTSYSADKETLKMATSDDDDIPVAGRFALVNWEAAVYPCRIYMVDSMKDVAEVSFMEESNGKGGSVLFRWPTKPDIQTINISQIVCMIKEPIACSKSRRQFKWQDDDYNYLDSDSD